MQKITKLALALTFTALLLQPASAREATGNSAGMGFDILGSYYIPTDSRYQGIGTGFGMNIKLDDSLTMGYRVEELNVRGDDTTPGGVQVSYNPVITMQGITAYYRTFGSEKLAVDFGMWMGAATASSFNSAGTIGVTSPLLEPLGRVTYTSSGKLDAHVVLGVGYRFIRKFTITTPFAGCAKALSNFDGLEITFGVGVSF
ncbi:MAG TPA: hypothetical protein DCL44_06095 [Elusimicrobia bacterium]|nr:hypothetical protein [Elusimicrobiota bacterium]